MMHHVLIDTGPLVASINRRDRFHDWTCSALAQIAPPLLTCEPVLAESCFLLQKFPGAAAAVLEMLHRGIVKVNFRVDEHILPLNKLMSKYANVSMSLADACLVRMSEMDAQSTILTLDAGFRVYRRNGRQVIPVMMPQAK
jgi:predicted nucleic acid-binding protein